MVRRYALISAAVALVLLGGCSKNNNEEGAATAGAGSSGGATSGATAGIGDYWPQLGPLLAGSHGGQCQDAQGAAAAGSAIAVGADGKLTAPGVDARLQDAASINLGRKTKNGVVRADVLVSLDDAGTALTLSDEGPGHSGAWLTQGEKQLTCPNTASLEKIRKQPLYKTLAQGMDVSPSSVECADTSTMQARPGIGFKLANGIATLGDQTYDLGQARDETLMLTKNEIALTYALTAADGTTLHLSYAGPGKLKGIQTTGQSRPVLACEVKG